MTKISLDVEHLEQEGYTVVPSFLDLDMTRRIRQHMDDLMPPIAKPDDPSQSKRVTLRHPIPGSIMATSLANPDLISLAKESLRADELKLLEQVLIRSDPGPPPYGASGWHIDWAFFPRQYQATPRQTYYHMVHCLNTVPTGGAAFMIVPGSHHKTYAVSAKMNSVADLANLKQDPAGMAGVDLNHGIEVCPNEGDLLVFNPMTIHSASGNASDQSRYVYFTSFFDISATELSQRLLDTGYHTGFPDSLRDDLPEAYQSLLAW